MVDKDQWSEAQLSELHAWSEEKDSYGLAVSNPCFEYWLLLHFDEGADVPNADACRARLQRHLPTYHKCIDSRCIAGPAVDDAVRRAAARDTPRCERWPLSTGTTVYRLVQRILEA